MPDDPVAVCDERVDLVLVLTQLGVEISHPPEGTSLKVFCPFSFLHEDGGAAPALRVYSTNTAFCFAEDLFFTPSSLAAVARDVTRREAAEQLLEEAGIPSSSDYRERFEQVVRQAEAPLPDIGSLQQALRASVALHPQYRARQYDPDVLQAWDAYLQLAARVGDEAKARSWLSTCRSHLIRLLESSAP